MSKSKPSPKKSTRKSSSDSDALSSPELIGPSQPSSPAETKERPDPVSHRTYRTRAKASEAEDSALSDYAELFSKVMRVIHARIEAHTKATGEVLSAGAFKNEALVEFGLTGRQFNAIQSSLDGMRSAVVECEKLNVETIKDRLIRLALALAELEKSLLVGRLIKGKTVRIPLTVKGRKHAKLAIHGKTRSLTMWTSRQAEIEARQKTGEVSMCFGSRALFMKQHFLEENGYASHAEWLLDWQAARSSQFLVKGAKSEESGCDGCVATVAKDGTISLRIKLPYALHKKHGIDVEVHGLHYAYGHDKIVAAIESNAARKITERQVRTEAKDAKIKFSETNVKGGTALTWRILRSEKGWEVLVSVAAVVQPRVSLNLAGRVAVDINAGFLAVSETDYYGNWVASFSVPCLTQGKTSDQAMAAIGDAVKFVVAYAILVCKPIVLEKLDFKAKKRGLKAEHPNYARMLSSFAYGKIKTLFEARCLDAGIEVQFVNPAYTSVIGRVKYSVPLGITTHEAAAVAIARRSQDLRERAPQPGRVLPVPVKGNVTAWTSPDWMISQHRAYPWQRIACSLPRLSERDFTRKKGAASPPPITPAVKVPAPRSTRAATSAGKAARPPV